MSLKSKVLHVKCDNKRKKIVFIRVKFSFLKCDQYNLFGIILKKKSSFFSDLNIFISCTCFICCLIRLPYYCFVFSFSFEWRELAAESIYKERCIPVNDGASWAKYMSTSGSTHDEYDIITLQYTEEGLLSIDENREGHAAAFGDDIAIECLATEFKREIYVVRRSFGWCGCYCLFTQFLQKQSWLKILIINFICKVYKCECNQYSNYLWVTKVYKCYCT